MSTAATPAETRERLLDATEELCRESDVDAVSLREVGRRAGARNVQAVQYWFGTKDGLIEAVLERHRPDIDVRRHTLLDAWERNGSEAADALRPLAEALVLPLASKLEQGPSGAGYLRLVTDLLHRPRPSMAPWAPQDPASSMLRWRDVVEPLLDPAAVALHRRFHTARFVIGELGERALAEPRGDDALFVSQLVDAAAGLLGAPISAQTRALLGRG